MQHNNPLILHIPHSSTTIPDSYRHIYRHPGQLNKELFRLTDLYTDELFTANADTLIFPVSRFLCDVERFRDKKEEEMTKKGMWICYTHTPLGQPLADFDEAHEREILTTYYDRHHAKFTRITAAKLAAYGQAIIIDCHSFPDHLPYYPVGPTPDICLGSDKFHTSPEMLNNCRRFFERQGYNVAINHPFAGSIVPMAWYSTDKRVQSIMIEVNRKLYCHNDGKKTPNFTHLQQDLNNFLHSSFATANAL